LLNASSPSQPAVGWVCGSWMSSVPNALRGRVVSIYMVALRGGGPIGGLVAGALADKFSAPGVMAVNGLLLAAIAGSLLLFRKGSSLTAASA